ncbi:MAG: glycosyltransferase family 2 protein, partial [Sarcina sp.]
MLSIILIIIYVRFGHDQHLETQKIRMSNVTYKGFSILIPCYNSVNELKASINHLKKIKYPDFEVIFINDGSTDHSMEKFKYLLDLELDIERTKKISDIKIKGIYKSKNFENVYVIDKLNEGRVTSLDYGVKVSSKEFIVVTTITAMLKRDALFLVNMNLQDEDIIATGGSILIKQGIDMDADGRLTFREDCKLVEYAQFMEYIATFYVMRNSMIRLNCISVISSSFGVIKKSVVEKIGNFKNKENTSMDLSILLSQYAKKYNKKITYDDRAICFENACNNIFTCCAVRAVWQKSFMSTFKRHRKYLTSGCFKEKLFLLAFFNTIFLGYISIILILTGIFYLGISFFAYGKIGLDVYTQVILGLVIFLIYSFINIRIASENNLDFKNFKKNKIILIHL